MKTNKWDAAENDDYRINTLVHAPAAMVGYTGLHPALEELYSVFFDAQEEPVIGAPAFSAEGSTEDDFFYWLLQHDLSGFFALIEAPTSTPESFVFDDSTGDWLFSNVSWGVLRTQWVYGKDFRQVRERAKAWRAKVWREQKLNGLRDYGVQLTRKILSEIKVKTHTTEALPSISEWSEWVFDARSLLSVRGYMRSFGWVQTWHTPELTFFGKPQGNEVAVYNRKTRLFEIEQHQGDDGRT